MEFGGSALVQQSRLNRALLQVGKIPHWIHDLADTGKELEEAYKGFMDVRSLCMWQFYCCTAPLNA